jgi:hypothetical protein
MGQTARFQETHRRKLRQGRGRALVWPGQDISPGFQDRFLLHVAVSVAIGPPAVCLEWTSSRALAAAAIDDEIADELLVIAPDLVAALG